MSTLLPSCALTVIRHLPVAPPLTMVLSLCGPGASPFQHETPIGHPKTSILSWTTVPCSCIVFVTSFFPYITLWDCSSVETSAVVLSFIALSLGRLAAAGPALSPYTIHEKRTHVPASGTVKRRHDPSTPLPLRFALSQGAVCT